MKRFTILMTLVSLIALLTLFSAAAAGAQQGHTIGEQTIESAADADAHGAEHGAEHGGVSVIEPVEAGVIPAITAIVVFLIALGLMSTMVWPRIVAGLDERNEKIVGEIAAAEAARMQAREALDEYEKNLASARAESQKMLEETRAQQSTLAAQLKANADAELGAMREKALSEIEAAKKQALGELYSESVSLATVMAGKILQRQVTADDQQRLMDESLREMKSVHS